MSFLNIVAKDKVSRRVALLLAVLHAAAIVAALIDFQRDFQSASEVLVFLTASLTLGVLDWLLMMWVYKGLLMLTRGELKKKLQGESPPAKRFVGYSFAVAGLLIFIIGMRFIFASAPTPPAATFVASSGLALMAWGGPLMVASKWRSRAVGAAVVITIWLGIVSLAFIAR